MIQITMLEKRTEIVLQFQCILLHYFNNLRTLVRRTRYIDILYDYALNERSIDCCLKRLTTKFFVLFVVTKRFCLFSVQAFRIVCFLNAYTLSNGLNEVNVQYFWSVMIDCLMYKVTFTKLKLLYLLLYLYIHKAACIANFSSYSLRLIKIRNQSRIFFWDQGPLQIRPDFY